VFPAGTKKQHTKMEKYTKMRCENEKSVRRSAIHMCCSLLVEEGHCHDLNNSVYQIDKLLTSEIVVDLKKAWRSRCIPA